MSGQLLLATDLDRTLLPNGAAPESPEARPRFRALAGRREVLVAYVTGRHRQLVEQALAEFDLPRPDFVIGDVGSNLYDLRGGDWLASAAWQRRIAADWAEQGPAALAGRLADLPALRLQEADKQASFKLSYYGPLTADAGDLLAQVRERLAASGARVNLIWSLDEAAGVGLLDILPAAAGKLHALDYLRQSLAIPARRTVFAGDSGNDLEVLASALPAVLVANAATEVRAQALAAAAANGHDNALYLATGRFLGMNGNYAAGILEGLAHYLPESRAWMGNEP